MINNALQSDDSGTRNRCYIIFGNGTLLLQQMGKKDEGNYTFYAKNTLGEDAMKVSVQVVSNLPQISSKYGRTENKILAVYYQTLLLDCKAEGMPEPQITWTTPYGMSLPTPYLGGRFQVHRNGTLELRGIRKTDEGRFLCIAKNYLGEASLAVDLEVASLDEKPSFPVPKTEVLSLEADGDDISLECRATGKPKPEFLWILPNGTAMSPGMKLQWFFHYLGNGTLHIMQTGVIDKGVYQCLAKNVAGQAEKCYALEPGQKPHIRSTTLNMPCNADGCPQATIIWTLPNGLVLDKSQVIGRVTYLSNGTLQVKETSEFDRGSYTCKATNTFGSSTLSYPVSVMVFPPQITHAPPSITRVNRGSPVILNCIAAGIPKPDISWTLPGRTTLEGNLVIKDPGLMNSGIYKCNARNAVGTDFKCTKGLKMPPTIWHLNGIFP
uniref:Ig-like domain-containing protein n=2 Tax=Cyprinus carpio TaxID=7962 RepID=A0A8C0YVL5_CYPCA